MLRTYEKHFQFLIGRLNFKFSIGFRILSNSFSELQLVRAALNFSFSFEIIVVAAKKKTIWSLFERRDKERKQMKEREREWHESGRKTAELDERCRGRGLLHRAWARVGAGLRAETAVAVARLALRHAAWQTSKMSTNTLQSRPFATKLISNRTSRCPLPIVQIHSINPTGEFI